MNKRKKKISRGIFHLTCRKIPTLDIENKLPHQSQVNNSDKK